MSYYTNRNGTKPGHFPGIFSISPKFYKSGHPAGRPGLSEKGNHDGNPCHRYAVLPLRFGFLPGPAEKLLQSPGEFHGHFGPIGEEEFRKAIFLAVLRPVVGIPKSGPGIGIFAVRIHGVGVEPRNIVRVLRRILRERIAHLAGHIRHISRAYQILRGYPHGADMGHPAVRRQADELVHAQIPVLCFSQSRVSGEKLLSRKDPDRVSLNGYALSRRIAVRRVVKGHHQDLVLFLIPRHQITVLGDLHQRIDFLLPGHNGVLNRLLVQGLHRGGSLPRHRMRNRCGCAADTDSRQQRKNNGGTVCFVHGVLPAFPFEGIIALHPRNSNPFRLGEKSEIF